MGQPNQNHPGLKKFQAAKAQRKAIAILATEVAALHPTYSKEKCVSIATASIEAQGRVDQARKGRGRRGNRGPNRNSTPRKRKPQSDGFKLLATKL